VPALKRFFVLLLFVAAVNGVVALYQANITPEQFAQWGPGYAEKINGTGDVSARGFADEEGVKRTRPFGLGHDMGFAGAIGVLAIPAGLALLGLRRRRRDLMIAAPLMILTIAGVVTSQARVAVIGAVAAAVAFLVLSVASREHLAGVFATLLGAVVALGVVVSVASNSDSSAFHRYRDIGQSNVIETTI
jgi:hypothetical protein